MYGTIDTVLVQEKQLDKAKDANAGTRVSTIDIEILNSNRTKSLAELLSENSVVYIKSLGQGALATSSFRGTSSTHTRVNWNGLNINPPMAGSFNFSQIPVFFTDNVELQYGAGNVKNGTGSIGGSIRACRQFPPLIPHASLLPTIRQQLHLHEQSTHEGSLPGKTKRGTIQTSRIYARGLLQNFRQHDAFCQRVVTIR